MKKSFREQCVDKVKQQVSSSGGWLLITSRNSSVLSLLKTGRRLQQTLLKTRQKGIAIHPMMQMLEETAITKTVNQFTSINGDIQFVLGQGV